jgi:hypothetical protein
MGRILVAVTAIAITLFLQGEAEDYPRAAARLPTLLGYLVILLALLAIGQVLLGWRRDRAEGTLSLVSMPAWRDVAIGLAFAGLIVLYAWSIPVLGYLIATPLMLLVPVAALRPVGWKAATTTVVVVTGVIWIVFVWFLNLPIPLHPSA